MKSSIALRLFLTTEQCEVLVAPDNEVVLRRSDDPRAILLSDPSVPRDPEGIAKFRLQEGKLYLVPSSAAKPVLLNGSKITVPEALEPGDRIRVGYTVLVVQALSERDDECGGDVRTLSLGTTYWQRRAPLVSEADRLGQWSEQFDRMTSAKNEVEAAQIILEQLLRLVRGSRGLLALGQPDRARMAAVESASPLRELDACGLNANEIEQSLRWCGQQPAQDKVLMPTIHEVLGAGPPGRAFVGRLDSDEEPWAFYLEPAPGSTSLETGNRAMAVLSNMVVLFRTLHRQQKHERLLGEVTQTARVFARRAEQGNLDVVQSKFVSCSDVMRAASTMLARAAAAPSPVLLLGEPGTGKQLAAEAVHAASNRAHREMVTVSLVEIPEALVESQLFGHVGKIFTGARDSTGLVARAHLSTLFLDEIGEAPLSIQSKLLRVLEYGVFQKIGAPKTTKVDIRLIAATNRDLDREVREGRFRQDLFDRISVIPIELPPLRERPEDIPLLVERFLNECNVKMSKRVKISAEGQRHLQTHTWPDNVRGLRNYIERTVALAESNSSVLGPKELPLLRTVSVEADAGIEVAGLEQQLRQFGRHNQARILRTLSEGTDRLPKGAWSERIGMSRPVFRRELQELIAFSSKHGVPLSFYERRVALREEDLREIDRLERLPRKPS